MNLMKIHMNPEPRTALGQADSITSQIAGHVLQAKISQKCTSEKFIELTRNLGAYVEYRI